MTEEAPRRRSRAGSKTPNPSSFPANEAIDSESALIRKRLASRRRRVANEGGLVHKEVSAQLDGLPIIDEITYEMLGNQLNLSSATIPTNDNPYDRGVMMAKGVFGLLNYIVDASKDDANDSYSFKDRNGPYFLKKVQK